MKTIMQIMWHLNNECNFQCLHCYEELFNPNPVDRWEFQLSVINRIVELQKFREIIRVGLLGGEPLLDPNIVKVVNALYDRGIKRVDISTNGSLADKEMVKALKKANVTMAQISLEGPVAEVNDKVRGRGSFDKAIKGLRLFNEFGISTGIMMTVTKFNLQFIEEMVVFGLKEGVSIVSFNRMLPLGRGKKRKLPVLDAEEVKQMITSIHSLDENNPGIEVSSDDPLLYVPINGKSYTVNTYGGCGAGIGNLAICHDGTIFPCRRLPVEIGNSTNNSLIDIINSSALDCLYDRENSLKGKCRVCDHRQICGGCRASALAFTGDHLQSDPQCWQNPEERR